MTAPATYLITRWPVFHSIFTRIDGFCNFYRTVWGAGTCCAMTLGAGTFIGALMATYPSLANRVHDIIVWTTEGRLGYMADRAGINGSGMALQKD